MTLSIAGEDKMWVELCQLLGLSSLASLNENERSARVDEIDPLLRAAIRQWNYKDIYAKLEQHGIAFGPLIPIEEVMSNPQIKERRMNQNWGSQSFVAQPIQFNGIKFPIQRGVPGLGEQTQNFVEE